MCRFIWYPDEHVKVQVLCAISFAILLYYYTLHRYVGFSSLNIKDQSVSFLAGVFLPRPLKELAEDEQYMQENGIGDIDVIMGFNNMEGSLVLFMLHFAQLPPESLYSPQFFHTVADICLMLNQVHDNQVVRKVSAYLSVYLSLSCQSVCLPASLSLFLCFFFFFVFLLKVFSHQWYKTDLKLWC